MIGSETIELSVSMWTDIIYIIMKLLHCNVVFNVSDVNNNTIFLFILWENKVCRFWKWSMIEESFISRKRFKNSDFVYDTNNKNACRKRKIQNENLKYRNVKNESYTNKIPNYPSYLLKKEPLERPCLGSLDAKILA